LQDVDYDQNLHSYAAERCSKYGVDFFIISAGWGIIRGEFPLPWYNITFGGKTFQKFHRSLNALGQNHIYPDAIQAQLSKYKRIYFLGTMDYIKYLGYLMNNYGLNELQELDLILYSFAGRDTALNGLNIVNENINVYPVKLQYDIGMWNPFYQKLRDLFNE
jgi:hypothetical protein